MKYPKFLKRNSVIGICAPSSGVGRKLDSFDLSLSNLKSEFNIVETNSVRTNSCESNTPINRGVEFNDLLKNKDIEMIFCASGGDFCISALEHIDFDLIKDNPVWVEGYSDPTSILYYITTKYDVATIYGNNAGSFDQTVLHKSLKYNIDLLKGDVARQNKFDFYEKDKGTNELSELVVYNNINGDVDETGRIIGGCLDIIRNIIGTKYDCTKDFIDRYKSDGIIWYFDIFSMSVEDLYNTLYQFKYSGYFENTKCILIGRVLYKSGFTEKTYESVLNEILPDIKIICDFDIGHVFPKMTIINGSLVHIVSNENEAFLDTYLK